jgi:hypothetical protein
VHFFTIPALAPAAAQQELNQFLSAHRVVVFEKQWISAGTDSAWAICVTVALGQGTLPAELKLPSAKTVRTERLDYREILNPDDFAVFASLRPNSKAPGVWVGSQQRTESLPGCRLPNGVFAAKRLPLC